jgi:hypothetical protein
MISHQVRFVRVAKGGHFHIILLQEAIEKLAAAVAYADETDADFLVRPARCANQRRARDIQSQGHRRGRGGRTLQESTSCRFLLIFTHVLISRKLCCPR